MTNNTENKRQQLKAFLDEQLALKLIERRSYYDSLAEDDMVDEPFDVWNEDMSVLESYKEQATLDDIEKLEKTTQRQFPDALKSFWQEFGMFGGEINFGELTFGVNSVEHLLSKFSAEAKPYEKLPDLGIASYMNWVWGNNKEFFKIQEGQVISNGVDTPISFEQLQAFNNKYTCFGTLCDGYFESFLFLHYSQESDDELNHSGQFGMTYWHQDDLPPAEQHISGFDTPEDLLLACIKGYKAVLAEDTDLEEDDEPYFDLQLLTEWLHQQN